jgi:hypothetical protein
MGTKIDVVLDEDEVDALKNMLSMMENFNENKYRNGSGHSKFDPSDADDVVMFYNMVMDKFFDGGVAYVIEKLLGENDD